MGYFKIRWLNVKCAGLILYGHPTKVNWFPSKGPHLGKRAVHYGLFTKLFNHLEPRCLLANILVHPFGWPWGKHRGSYV